jgi:hypothetical protein
MMSKAGHASLLLVIAGFAVSPASAQAPLAIHIHGEKAMFQGSGFAGRHRQQ